MTCRHNYAVERTGRRLLCQPQYVTDPAIRQPGFDLPHRTWSLLNRFWTDQGPCRANVHKWGLAQSASCDCGQRQTMKHIVDTCPLTQFEGGLNLLHKVDDDAGIYSDCSTREVKSPVAITSMTPTSPGKSIRVPGKQFESWNFGN